jgi:hypothetical protein
LNRRICYGIGGIAVIAALALLVNCDYSRPPTDVAYTGTYRGSKVELPRATAAKQVATVARDPNEKAAILKSAIELIKGAALQPGGANFSLATQKLNQYFEGTPDRDYQIAPAARAFLETQLPRNMLREVEKPAWGLRDARHLEDCMMYYGIASRVGGTGDDLSRVRRVFDWVVRHVQLVPPGSLGSRQLPQAMARPYDLLLRGMGTESDGFWAERAWLFIALCRQLGVDAGLLTYTKGNVLEPLVPRTGQDGQEGGALLGLVKLPKPTIGWICAALVDDKAYLFDARIGLPIAGPGGEGVATLDQALADPAILERMNLPSQSPYGTSRATLLASPTKISVLIDSSQGYFNPRMKLLQRELAGKNRTILHRDPAAQHDHFAAVLGEHLGTVRLWQMPLEVETRLFTDPQFVNSTMQSLFLFQPKFPLILARVKQLRGEFSEAIQEYVSFRLAENVPLVNDKKQMIPKAVREGMDVYATYYLALAHLEQNNLKGAADMFLNLLELVPEPGPNQPYYNMFRWGAHANLGRIYEAKGDYRRAIAHYSQSDPTMQNHGNLLRARELVWLDPMAEPPDPLPPAPRTFGAGPVAQNLQGPGH